jgi:iron complex transport system permease protein
VSRGTATPVRAGAVSGVVHTRTLGVLAATVVVAVLAVVLSIGRGDIPLSSGEVLAVLLGGGERIDRFVVMDLRLPRALVGLLVGVALGLAGAIMQAVTRNPLAAPDVLGISNGASVGAVAVIVLAPSFGAAVGIPMAALGGGLLAGAVIYALAWKDGLDSFRFVLIGIGVAAFSLSLTSWLLVQAEINEATQATAWLTGSLNARSWDHVVPVGIAVATVGLFAVPLSFSLKALSLGDESAVGLGLRVNAARTGLLLVAVVLASVATASAGPVPFVALVAPQLALRLTRSAEPPLLTSGAIGACLLTVSDLIARTVLPSGLPVGIVTGLIGAPYLLYLIRRKTREVTA